MTTKEGWVYCLHPYKGSVIWQQKLSNPCLLVHSAPLQLQKCSTIFWPWLVLNCTLLKGYYYWKKGRNGVRSPRTWRVSHLCIGSRGVLKHRESTRLCEVPYVRLNKEDLVSALSFGGDLSTRPGCWEGQYHLESDKNKMWRWYPLVVSDRWIIFQWKSMVCEKMVQLWNRNE